MPQHLVTNQHLDVNVLLLAITSSQHYRSHNSTSSLSNKLLKMTSYRNVALLGVSQSLHAT